MTARSEPRKDPGLLLALLACIIGGALRLYTALIAGFPINDGGLFLNMIAAIQKNGYALPEFVSYNGLEIPFAYPPFGFYLASLAHALTGISLIEVLRWLPAVIATLTIYAVFALAEQLLDSRIEAGIAALFYALLPRSTTWLIMGGGITRSLGQLFLITTIYALYRLFSTGERKYIWASILSSSLVCLTHPEATIHTIGIAVLLWLFKGRDRKNTLRAVAVAIGTLALTAIWWVPILIRHGLSPYVSAAGTGLHDPLFFLYFFTLPFSDEPHITFIFVFAILGLVVSVARRRYLVPLFYLLPFVIEPRNAANVSAISMGMLASVALDQMILARLEELSKGLSGRDQKNRSPGLISSLFLGYLFLALFIGMLHFSVQLADKRVTDENLKAFDWITKNTPPDSRFLVLTGKTDLFGDWTLEWFPTLTHRISETTIQGREWTDGEAFTANTRQFQDLQACLFASEPLHCVRDLSRETNREYGYIYISQRTMRSEKHILGSELILELAAIEAYDLVYESDEVAIFRSP